MGCDTEASVTPKLWIPVTSPTVLKTLESSARELATDLLANKMGEKKFMGKIARAFPELSYFSDSHVTTQRDQTYGAMLSSFWLLTSSHEAFVRQQPEDDRLSKQS